MHNQAGMAWLKTQKSWVVNDEYWKPGIHHSRWNMGGQRVLGVFGIVINLSSDPSQSIPLNRMKINNRCKGVSLIFVASRRTVRMIPKAVQIYKARLAPTQPVSFPTRAAGSQNPV